MAVVNTTREDRRLAMQMPLEHVLLLAHQFREDQAQQREHAAGVQFASTFGQSSGPQMVRLAPADPSPFVSSQLQVGHQVYRWRELPGIQTPDGYLGRTPDGEVLHPLPDGDCPPGYRLVVHFQGPNSGQTFTCEPAQLLLEQAIQSARSVQQECPGGSQPIFDRAMYDEHARSGLNVSPADERYWNCAGEIFPGGNDDGCEVGFRTDCAATPRLEPNLGSGGLKEFLLMGITEPKVLDAVDVRRNWEGCEREFIELAGQLLRDNLDLVQWVMCLIGVNQDISNNMTALLQSRTTPIKKSKDNPLTGGCHDGVTAARAINGNILICAGAQPIRDMMGTWCCGNIEERLCALITMAAFLAHELLHLAGWTARRLLGEIEGPGRCHSSYVLQQTLLWGFAKRYPATASASCCDRLFNVPGLADSGNVNDGFFGEDHELIFVPTCTSCVYPIS